MPWDPSRYHQFQRERFAPFEDLLGLIDIRPGMRVIDLGCGTGELTARLADALPGSDVLGIDSSTQMLERAQLLARPGLRFTPGDIETVEGTWDLVFSHAAIQWVSHHDRLVPRLLSLVRPGGRLAVQLPSNHDHPSHMFIQETALEEPFRSALGGWNRASPVLTIEEYAELLFGAGAERITVYEKVYPHVLDDADAIADWTSGTALVPYMERLPQELHEPFMQRYRQRLRELYPQAPVFYGFRRILFAGSPHPPAPSPTTAGRTEFGDPLGREGE
jgi:trans-aconitate 2-methyltransferase